MRECARPTVPLYCALQPPFPPSAFLPRRHRPALQARRAPRPLVGFPVREGLPPPAWDAPLDPARLQSEFGLAGTSFARAVPLDRREELACWAGVALDDMARALRLPRRAMGLGGTLVVHFGDTPADPADRDGPVLRFRAHGGGLAAGWACALEQWLGCPLDAWPPACRHPDLAVARALTSVGAALWRGDPDSWMESMDLRTALDGQTEAVRQAEQQRDAYVARRPDAAADPEGARYLQGVERWLISRRGGVIPDLRRRLDAARRRDAEAGPGTFAPSRGGCDGGALFARAFECAVNDALAARGGRNQCLVDGVGEGRLGGAPDGMAVPRGAARGTICTAIVQALAVLAPQMACSPQAVHQDEGPHAAPVAMRR